jgi:hypothetical protein
MLAAGCRVGISRISFLGRTTTKESELVGLDEVVKEFEGRLSTDAGRQEVLAPIREALRTAKLGTIGGELMTGGPLQVADGCWRCTYCITPCVSCIIST